MSTTNTKVRTPFLTTREAAAYCDIHPESLRQACRRREVAYYKKSGGTSPYKFRKADLDHFMNRRRVEADSWGDGSWEW